MSAKLAKASEIRRTLARAKDVAEVNEVRAKASALAEYERLRGAWAEALRFEGIALDAHLESGRRLASGPRLKGRPQKKVDTASIFPARKLLGIESDDEAQKLAQRQTKAYRLEDEKPERVVEYRKAQEALGPAGSITLCGLLGERAPGSAVHVSQNTGQPEWYTPSEFIEAARRVLGAIDLDPASSDVAQKTVKAGLYYTVEDDGLAQAWKGRVWMNPPYTAGLVDRFLEKLCEHLTDGSVPAAIVLVNNSTDTAWFQMVGKFAAKFCFPAGRIRFLDEAGEAVGAPLQGQVILYFGDAPEAFEAGFSAFGLTL